MKKLIITLTALAISAGGYGQTNNKQVLNTVNMIEKEKTEMKTYNIFKDFEPAKEFNIKEFDAKGDGNDYHFVDSNGMEVKQRLFDEFPSGKVTNYVENRNYPNSAYKFYSEYDANGKLLKTSISFYGMVVGFMCFYNTAGEIIKKEDWDMPYKFSVDNLIDKMKTEYDIDIVDTKICNDILRGVYEKHGNNPLYDVYLYGHPMKYQLICYVIDGNTGETLFTTTRHIRENREPITDEYFNSLKNQK
jgi:uncharacterized protein YxeA